jgi:hypothetical protein
VADAPAIVGSDEEARMRPLTAVEESNARLLQNATRDVTYLFPTATGLQKGIMDAIAPVREFLRRQDLHEFEGQGRGSVQHGVRIPAYLVLEGGLRTTTASLYRPKAKPGRDGDPRIWIYGLPEHAGPGDALALFAHQKELYVLNLSSSTVASDRDSGRRTAAIDLLASVHSSSRVIAIELFTKLRDFAKRPLKAVATGDFAIGWTIEAALGIPPNTSKAPDYKGIELKSSRAAHPGLTTLFAQEPDWATSNVKSQDALLDTFGYWRNGRANLKCTVSAIVTNSQGLRLRVDDAADDLVEYSIDPMVGDALRWRLRLLRERLTTKHPETFWIAATRTYVGADEYYQLESVEYTRSPVIDQLPLLLAGGDIVVDHRVHRDPGKSARSHGTAFRLARGALGLLFPGPERWDLR